MFIQIIQGQVRDVAGIRRQLDRWKDTLADDARGWLGSTVGVTDDGELFAAIRFESQEAAQRNSDRPEQGRWWADTERYLDGAAIFRDCPDVELYLDGGSDDAGFVQVVQARAKDVAGVKAAGKELNVAIPEHRPDIVGGVVAWHGDDTFSDIIYFTSEKEARYGESKEMPSNLQTRFDDFSRLLEEPRYIDLKEPWLFSP